jgi:hypothetical protein
MDVTTVSRRWRDLLPDQRRWIARNAVVTGIANLVGSAAIAWLSVRGVRSVPLWSIPWFNHPSTITDTVGTFFFLPLLTCLSCTTAIRSRVRRGHLTSLRPSDAGRWLSRLPAGTLRRGLTFGAITAAVLAPMAVILLLCVHFAGMSRPGFIEYKAVLGVALGAVVTPLIAVRALADAVPAEARALI